MYHRMSMRCPKLRNYNVSPNTLGSLREVSKVKELSETGSPNSKPYMGSL